MDDMSWIVLAVFAGLATIVFLRLLATERESVLLMAEIEAAEAEIAERHRKIREAKMEAAHISEISDVEVV